MSGVLEIGSELKDQIAAVAGAAAGCARIAVSTGAGVSAESGIPTFREAQTGLWAKHDPVMLASPQGFARDPANVWRWYDDRRQTMRKCQPNAGHVALAEWQREWLAARRSFTLVTQNIDNLHARAGSTDIVELHGNIWYVRPDGGDWDTAFYNDECPLARHPLTDESGRLLRPHVVWFGETLDPRNLDRAFNAAANCDMLLVVGTSAVVYPAAALPQVALRAGAVVVEVNPNWTDFSDLATHCLRGPGAVVLPALLQAVRQATASTG
jgi:NAD-dependent deacetylase